MKGLLLSRFSVLLIFILILEILFVTASGVGGPSTDTRISINPKNLIVNPGENFTVDVYCVPGQPIKAYELKISFNPSRVKAIKVTEGNIFNGFSTFFNKGNVNNNAGTITDIYGLILGSGNVTTPGTFVKISFSSKETSGSFNLDISNVGVTDEIGYVSIETSEGTISVKATNDDPYAPPAGPYVNNVGENYPPEVPLKPSGPTFVEMGVGYIFSSSSYDIDGDQIKYRFFWGDGNYSNWTNFIASNKTVSMSHNFTSINKFEVRVIAQDEKGVNSSWSPPLNVTVSQSIFGEKPPIANFSIIGNLSVNKTIFFDGSSSFDEDGIIVFYYWDFGDGTNASGKNLSHIYNKPGEYTVTLIVTDSNGYSYSKTILIAVSPEIEEESLGNDKSIIPFDFSIIFIVITIVLLTWIIFLLKNNIITFVSTFSQYKRLIFNRKIKYTNNLIKRNNESDEIIRDIQIAGIDLKKSHLINSNYQSYKNNYFIENVDKSAGIETSVVKFYDKSNENTEFEDIESQIDSIIYRDKVDEPIGTTIQLDKVITRKRNNVDFKDIESQIDYIILSNEIANLKKFDIEKERMLSKLESNDIERMVDSLF